MAARADDRRVQRTRKLLMDALMELMLEKGYETLTVQDIIDRANVGRSTFYTLGFSLAMLHHVQDHHRLYQAIVGKQGGAVVQQHLQRIVADLVKHELAALVPSGTPVPVPLDVVVEYTVSSFLALMTWWLGQKMPCSAEEMDRMFRALTLPGITSVLGLPATVT